MKEKEQTYRIFSIVCYDKSDTLSFNDIISKVISYDFDYFYIKHDKDKNKPHYHLAIYIPIAHTITYIADKLGINNTQINVKDDRGVRYTLKSTIKYFLHYGIKDKESYTIDELISNRQDTCNKYYDILTGGKNEKQELKEIMLFIEMNSINKINQVLQFCIENDYLKTFKKYSYILNQVVKENNYK